MGGYVALYAQIIYQLPVKKIITLGTKFNWNEQFTAKQLKFLKPEILAEKVPAFAQKLKDKFGENYWQQVVNYTADMMQQLGTKNLLHEQLSKITVPVTFLLGEKDDMVTHEETESIQLQLQHSTFHLLPNTLHAIEQVDAIVLLPYFLNN